MKTCKACGIIVHSITTATPDGPKLTTHLWRGLVVCKNCLRTLTALDASEGSREMYTAIRAMMDEP